MKEKILIADDDGLMRMLIRTTLEADGGQFDIYEAKNGADALEKARLIKPQILILDVMMPGITGYDVCKKLKDSPETRGIYVLFLTCRGGEMSRKTVDLCGGDDFMVKPFQSGDLEEKVYKVLGLAA